jgi:Bacterial PH domain
METAFFIVPAGGRPFYFLVPILLLLGVVLYLLCVVGYGSQRASFVLSDAGLDFRGDVWGSRLPWGALHVDKARVVDLTREPGLRPVSRRRGAALPGYMAGWFRLSDGERALLYVTARQRVVYVPTSAGYSLLLSPQDPEAMLAELRRRAGRRSGAQ